MFCCYTYAERGLLEGPDTQPYRLRAMHKRERLNPWVLESLIHSAGSNLGGWKHLKTLTSNAHIYGLSCEKWIPFPVSNYTRSKQILAREIGM